MILPDFCLPELVATEFDTSGIDSPEYCGNLSWFRQYPYAVSYRYNSRGFRDTEWPTSLDNCVWCIGDSFTVGLGVPFALTWPQQLQNKVPRPVITIAMDGASNQWIARKISGIQKHVRSPYVLAMWSYFQRREHSDTAKTDLQRREHGRPDTEIEDFELFETLLKSCDPSRLVNLFIPNCHDVFAIQKIWDDVRDPSWPICLPESLTLLSDQIQQELFNTHNVGRKLQTLLPLQQRLAELKQQYQFVDYEIFDMARDYHHFGPLTCTSIATEIANFVSLP